MIVAILVAGFIIGSLLMWTLAKAAGDADKRLDELYQAFLLRETPTCMRKSQCRKQKNFRKKVIERIALS